LVAIDLVMDDPVETVLAMVGQVALEARESADRGVLQSLADIVPVVLVDPDARAGLADLDTGGRVETVPDIRLARVPAGIGQAGTVRTGAGAETAGAGAATGPPMA
jgi:hypothetical protein